VHRRTPPPLSARRRRRHPIRGRLSSVNSILVYRRAELYHNVTTAQPIDVTCSLSLPIRRSSALSCTPAPSRLDQLGQYSKAHAVPQLPVLSIHPTSAAAIGLISISISHAPSSSAPSHVGLKGARVGLQSVNKWALQTVKQSRAVAEALLSTHLSRRMRRWHSQTNDRHPVGLCMSRSHITDEARIIQVV
jgi:hypothetical protein